jgi:hypothetical protein
MSDSEIQLDLRRNREQWIANVAHLISDGYMMTVVDEGIWLVSPDGQSRLRMPEVPPELQIV